MPLRPFGTSGLQGTLVSTLRIGVKNFRNWIQNIPGQEIQCRSGKLILPISMLHKELDVDGLGPAFWLVNKDDQGERVRLGASNSLIAQT